MRVMRGHKRRIVIPMGGVPLYAAGATQLAFDEARYLAELGYEVWAVAPDLSGTYPEHSIQDDVHILCYPQPRLNALDPRRCGIHQSLTSELLKRYTDSPPDVVHGHALLQYTAAMTMFSGRAKLCYSVHSPVKLEILANSRGAKSSGRLASSATAYVLGQLERYSLIHSDCITADSMYTQVSLGRLHGASVERRIQVVPGWVDPNCFRVVPDRVRAKAALGWRSDVPTLFTLRRLVPRMGLENLLYALQRVKAAGHGFHCVVGGRGPLLDNLGLLVRDLDLTNYVSLIGYVPADVVPLMYGSADAFVLPTAELECFGLPILESLACGRPVLATPIGAIPELVRQVEPKWLAADSSIGGIADLLDSFLSGASPAHGSMDLREWVVTRFSREGVLRELAQVVLDGIS